MGSTVDDPEIASLPLALEDDGPLADALPPPPQAVPTKATAAAAARATLGTKWNLRISACLLCSGPESARRFYLRRGS
jgi:hypothetical protein